MDNNTLIRYNDADLQEFKSLILVKMDAAREELKYYSASQNNENGFNEGGSYKSLEDGSATLEKEYAGQIASRQKKYIENLEAALVRIENKTYGICRVTGKLIPKERLKLVPHATLSMEAKLSQGKEV